MDKEKVLKWLNDLTSSIESYEKIRVLGDGIEARSLKNRDVCVENLRKVAETLGIPLLEYDFKCNGVTANHISIHYKGITFYELENYKETEE